MSPSIGAVRQRAILEAKTLTPDGGGGFTEDWETYAVVWAALRPGSGGERVEAGRIESRVSHTVAIRRRTDVSANHRLRIGERVFAIRALVDPGAQSVWMTLLCEEGAPS